MESHPKLKKATQDINPAGFRRSGGEGERRWRQLGLPVGPECVPGFPPWLSIYRASCSPKLISPLMELGLMDLLINSRPLKLINHQAQFI